MNPFVYVKNKLEERKARREQETPADRAARVTTNATVWMAAFTVVLAVLSGLTLGVLNNQLQEMRQGGIDAQTFFKDGQRAWVGVLDAVSEPQSFTETEPWKVTVIFFNSGRTPATNVQMSGVSIMAHSPKSGPNQEQISQLIFRPTPSIAPQANYRASVGSDFAAQGSDSSQKEGSKNLVSQYKLIKNKQLLLYYFGVLKYDDIFGNHRETQYCIFLADPDTKRVGICNAFNDLN